MYTSIDRVRTLSGFDDTTNITDENVKSKIVVASGMIDSAVGYKYTLPLDYHYQNTLTFSGTPSTGTLPVVVNGVTYNVSVVTGDTLAQVADKFRVACELSAHFITDDLGMGAEVMIISRSTGSSGYAEVNITNPIDTYVVTTVWTREKRYTPVLEQMTAEIATALLFIDEYGIEAQDTGKDWPTRMEAINEKLQMLQGVHESGQVIRIFDEVTHREISLTSVGDISSYPNDTSELSTTDSTSPKVWMNQSL